ncbi:DUF3800 domain-containing protein [Enterococcus italicus]|uniref:DUF3800 domain-containing protein n=1 Tax=Enterococcus italicus TaxID=246144 RepID=UPI002073D20D|nr:DUF3800 domain-containing protein [Enterococcus italicus]
MQTVFFYFDDSGVLHNNAPCQFFVYAGLSFISNEGKEHSKRLYRDISNKIKNHLNIEGELKSAGLEVKYKASLYRSIKNIDSVGVSVDISRVYDRILSNKKSIHRYKDYVLKRAVKHQIQYYLNQGILKQDEDIKIIINIDEQATATDGFYGLRDSIFEELKKGIANFDYGKFYDPIFSKNVIVEVHYCNSSCNHLIQASDVLANRIWTSYIINNRNLRIIPNHRCIHLP